VTPTSATTIARLVKVLGMLGSPHRRARSRRATTDRGARRVCGRIRDTAKRQRIALRCPLGDRA